MGKAIFSLMFSIGKGRTSFSGLLSIIEEETSSIVEPKNHYTTIILLYTSGKQINYIGKEVP